jgi:glycosyltransferase involved in cell wall biosynthesis
VLEGRTLIALDATVVGARLTGAGRVVSGLASWLPRVDPARSYRALAMPAGAVRLASAGVELDAVERVAGLSWELRGAQRLAARGGAELLFTVRELVGFGSVPTVMHVFEPPRYRLGAGRPPGLHGLKSRGKDRLLSASFGSSLRRAVAVTAGSATTADWIASRHGVTATVVLPGIDEVFREPASPPGGVRGPYVLCSESGDPRERGELVLEAFARARLTGTDLIVFGTPAAERERLRSHARRVGIEESVVFAGWVPDDQLRDLYAGAIAFVQATEYEAYAGLPALEALSTGTPVVALAAPGTVEALASRAVLVEQRDPDAFAVELRRLAADPSARTSLGEAGRAWAAGLTWEAAARALAQVFERVLSA